VGRRSCGAVVAKEIWMRVGVLDVVWVWMDGVWGFGWMDVGGLDGWMRGAEGGGRVARTLGLVLAAIIVRLSRGGMGNGSDDASLVILRWLLGLHWLSPCCSRRFAGVLGASTTASSASFAPRLC
jgi:hypothetical protein